MNALELTGQARTHTVDIAAPPCTLHVHAAAPFLNLRRAAAAAGFDLKPVSTFRDFQHQLAIWNAKFNGERPLYDASGHPLDALRLAPSERIEAILQWSALPGASRHHWGTDLDLIDANAIAPGYRVQLTAAEFSGTGPFAPLTDWLAAHAARFGFFLPFRGVRSGVQGEPWHYSFAPLAEPARRSLTPAVLRAALTAAPLAGREIVMARLEEWHSRFVAPIDWP
ncbi:MAG: M15 family metallopeptidase [Pseudomonadota bacterium]|nr:M15 family metallopeptidase [Pseudomonadota bacterium]